MIFCLLLVNLLSNEEQLDNLIDYSFPETSYSYLMDIDQDCLDSLSSLHHHNDNNQAEGEGGTGNLLYSMQIVLKVVIKYHTTIC